MRLAGDIGGGLNKTRNLRALFLNQGVAVSLLRKETPIWSLNTKLRFAQSELMNTRSGGEGFWLQPLELALPSSGLYGKAQIEVAELETHNISKMTFIPLDWSVLCQGTVNWSGSS